ncbi:MAG: hypothetical protein FJ290_27440 [Planctomycetes bacterium]|nr:hypothetical protein [Planctomycetota bacterium]
MRLAPSVSSWHDLVYHVLAHVAAPGGDASSLFDEAYVRWSARELGLHGGGVPRTLTLDAPLLAALYAASPQGFLLHAWPLLWDDAEGFLRDMPAELGAIEWADVGRARLAESIRAGTAGALPELFRTALWSEWANGYEAAWRRVVAPRSEAYRQEFAGLLGEVASNLPELRSFRWVLCQPLRWHGRLLEREGAPPVIAVGVADAELAVSAWDPVLQGCHECFVAQARRTGSGAPTGLDTGDGRDPHGSRRGLLPPAPDGAEAPFARAWSTVPGRAGHEGFVAVENAALALGARFFLGSPWEAAYLDWLRRFFPDEAPEATAGRLAAGT